MLLRKRRRNGDLRGVDAAKLLDFWPCRPDQNHVAGGQEVTNAGIPRGDDAHGDNKTTAEAVARRLGIDEVEAEVLPETKGRIVKSYKAKGVSSLWRGTVRMTRQHWPPPISVSPWERARTSRWKRGRDAVKGDLMGIVRAQKLSKSVMQKYPPEPVLRLRLQYGGCSGGGWYSLSAFGVLLQSRYGGSNHGAQFSIRDCQRVEG